MCPTTHKGWTAPRSCPTTITACDWTGRPLTPFQPRWTVLMFTYALNWQIFIKTKTNHGGTGHSSKSNWTVFNWLQSSDSITGAKCIDGIKSSVQNRFLDRLVSWSACRHVTEHCDHSFHLDHEQSSHVSAVLSTTVRIRKYFIIFELSFIISTHLINACSSCVLFALFSLVYLDVHHCHWHRVVFCSSSAYPIQSVIQRIHMFC